ncbi:MULTISPECIES: LPXTG cell wall anchor domain-containing protein [Enterococcus]|jgi:LPXTG-motif cell wall-anchored protein|uniref:LPXTG cell wall anchor domain-containing protein n=1 Tax=Enterococcus TaxID=1350 RepID=UPI00208FFEE2|nr:LPXTG cell wall anchor domain-containing protein [Enterococcus innesii]MCO5496733.1 LPXTG cell wall anchor domain-containing protein [Enterococcus innesii]MEB5919888.1 LPXTG cell wall anchor domain-containing protein [Enterococcus innesii]
MKKRKRIIFFIAALLALTVWELSETIVAEATTGQVTVTGRIGETAKEEEEADDDNKKTIVADASQIGQGKLPQTGSSDTSSLIILGYALIVFSILLLLSKSRHIYGTTDYYN